MAKIKEGILGPLSGKVGPVIGGTWKGIPYVKGVPAQVKTSATAAQIQSRKKLKFLNNLLVPFHPYITVGFTLEAAQKTEISAAFSKNYHTAVAGVYPNLSFIASEFVISVGNLPMIVNIQMQLVDPETLKLKWSQNEAKKTSFDDQVMLVVYCPELHEADGFVGGVKRSEEQCSFKLNETMVGKALDVYVSLSSIDRKRIANSKYLGRIGQSPRKRRQ